MISKYFGFKTLIISILLFKSNDFRALKLLYFQFLRYKDYKLYYIKIFLLKIAKLHAFEILEQNFGVQFFENGLCVFFFAKTHSWIQEHRFKN